VQDRVGKGKGWDSWGRVGWLQGLDTQCEGFGTCFVRDVRPPSSDAAAEGFLMSPPAVLSASTAYASLPAQFSGPQPFTPATSSVMPPSPMEVDTGARGYEEGAASGGTLLLRITTRLHALSIVLRRS
jgi:hypothetical protein